jgi:hypothetical protein
MASVLKTSISFCFAIVEPTRNWAESGIAISSVTVNENPTTMSKVGFCLASFFGQTNEYLMRDMIGR